MKYLQQREHVTTVHHQLFFEHISLPGSGFGFACDENGNVDVNALNPAARGNWEYAQSRVGTEFRAPRVQTFRNSHTIPAVIECRCGQPVTLESGWANTCDCGAEYNGSGQRLAPRSQWGEETGESF